MTLISRKRFRRGQRPSYRRGDFSRVEPTPILDLEDLLAREKAAYNMAQAVIRDLQDEHKQNLKKIKELQVENGKLKLLLRSRK